jgi:mannose-1-phosphate guanylyltransferase
METMPDARASIFKKESTMSTLEEVVEIQDSLPSVQDEKRRRWSIVLAGGQGQRMARWIESRHGAPRPKQFCAFTGSRTMLQHTLDRAVQVTPARNTITVIDRTHRRFLPHDRASDIPGRVIEQPADRGTAAGVLLPATYVRERDPDATVLILPSDHFIHPDHQFRGHASYACRLTDRFENRFVLLGAPATGAEADYGWILPERRRQSPELNGPGWPVWPVAQFREKPGPEEAASLFRAGGMWNTLVVAVKLRTLWAAGRRLVPGMIDRFEYLQRVLRSIRSGREDPRREAEVLHDIYLDMKPADFSRDLLQRLTSKTLVQLMHDVEWSDWGRPERVEKTLHRLIKGGPRDGLGSPAPAGPIPAWCRPSIAAAGGADAIGEMS